MARKRISEKVKNHWFQFYMYCLHNLSHTPTSNPQGIAYPSYPSKPLPLPLQNPYPHTGVGVLEGRGKGTKSLPRGYPCHSLDVGNLGEEEMERAETDDEDTNRNPLGSELAGGYDSASDSAQLLFK